MIDNEEGISMLPDSWKKAAPEQESSFWRHRKKFLFLGLAIFGLLCVALIFQKSLGRAVFLWVAGLSHVASATREAIPPRFHLDFGSQRVRIKLGPYKVPGRAISDGMRAFKQRMPSPCTDCLITFIQMGLEYTDGSVANTDTGLWLHHAVLVNMNYPDSTCSNFGERFFASGNERTPVDFTMNGTRNTGYYLPSNLILGYGAELMNTKPQDQDVYLTAEFEYINDLLPSGFSLLKPLWFDIAGCSEHPEMPSFGNSAFHYSSQSWVSESLEGRVMMSLGHLHDGATKIIVELNSQSLCDLPAVYGGAPAFISEDTGVSIEHISAIRGCYHSNVTLSLGNVLSTTAYYDTSVNQPALDKNGLLQDVMGISMVYVLVE